MFAWSTFFISKRASQALGSKKRKTQTMKRFTLASLLLLLCSGIALAQQPVNVLNIGGTAASTGNGTSGVGDLRVNIASDNTAFQVKLLGNAGAAFDAAQNAASPANELLEGGTFNTTLPT